MDKKKKGEGLRVLSGFINSEQVVAAHSEQSSAVVSSQVGCGFDSCIRSLLVLWLPPRVQNPQCKAQQELNCRV